MLRNPISHIQQILLVDAFSSDLHNANAFFTTIGPRCPYIAGFVSDTKQSFDQYFILARAWCETYVSLQMNICEAKIKELTLESLIASPTIPRAEIEGEVWRKLKSWLSTTFKNSLEETEYPKYLFLPTIILDLATIPKNDKNSFINPFISTPFTMQLFKTCILQYCTIQLASKNAHHEYLLLDIDENNGQEFLKTECARLMRELNKFKPSFTRYRRIETIINSELVKLLEPIKEQASEQTQENSNQCATFPFMLKIIENLCIALNYVAFEFDSNEISLSHRFSRSILSSWIEDKDSFLHKMSRQDSTNIMRFLTKQGLYFNMLSKVKEIFHPERLITSSANMQTFFIQQRQRQTLPTLPLLNSTNHGF